MALERLRLTLLKIFFLIKKIKIVKSLINHWILKFFTLRRGVLVEKTNDNGGLEKMSRAEAKTLAEENGAKVFGSLSKKLNYLVVGNSKPTRSKIEKAESLKIKF